jgi:hypothetical protein
MITLRNILSAIVLTLSFPATVFGQSPSSANGDRMLLVTYWDDDKVGLIDSQGQPGKEQVWTIDV